MPASDQVEGGTCYHDLASVPGGVDWVVIEGGCPCMFNPAADPGHKAMRFVFTLTGNVPRRVLRPRTPPPRHQYIRPVPQNMCRTNATAGKVG